MRYIVVLLALTGLLLSASQMPRMYANMGTPLFELVDKMDPLTADKKLGTYLQTYEEHAMSVRQAGLELGNNKDVGQRYLKQLRKLQKDHDYLMLLTKRELYKTMETGDYRRFYTLMKTAPDSLMQSSGFSKEVVGFYKKHRRQGHLHYLDVYIKAHEQPKPSQEKETHKKRVSDEYTYDAWAATVGRIKAGENAQSKKEPPKAAKPKPAKKTGLREQAKKVSRDPYAAAADPYSDGSSSSKKVTILTTKTCGACKAAKKFLRKKGIPFTEYDVNSSSIGKKLFQQNKGYAVPLILIGKEKMTGLDQDKFMKIYNQ